MRSWLIRLGPVAALLVGVLVVQAVWTSRYQVSGHAAEHLSSATSVFGITFLVGVILWGVGAANWRWTTGALAALVVAGAAVVTAANITVVDAMAGEDWSFERAEVLGPGLPGFTAGHDLAGRAAWFTLAAAVVLAAWLWYRRIFPGWVCAAAILLSLLVPSWIFPGAGLIVLALAAATRQVAAQRGRTQRWTTGQPSA